MRQRRDRRVIYDDTLTLRVRPSLVEEIDNVADLQEVNRSTVIRDALQQYVTGWRDRQTPEPAA